MSSVKISAMTAAVALDGTEKLAGVQSGSNVYATPSQIKTYARKNAVTALTSAAGVVNIDASLGDYFTITLTENVTSITFTNLAGAALGNTKMVQITQHASSAKTVAWPASFKWSGASAGVMSTTVGAVDVLAITSFDNGTTWRATLANGFA